jgi:hypothetical protein
MMVGEPVNVVISVGVRVVERWVRIARADVGAEILFEREVILVQVTSNLNMR